jgi:hypothetical protein
MILSKFATANRRDEIAAPEIRRRATMRRREAVLKIVAWDRPLKTGYVVGMSVAVEDAQRYTDVSSEFRSQG